MMASSSSTTGCAHRYHLGAGSSSLLQSCSSSASSPLVLQSRQCSPARFAAVGLGCKLATTELVPRKRGVLRRLRTQALRQDGDRDESGDETPESLFKKELKRRGLDPSGKSATSSTETKTKQETIGGRNTGTAAQSVKSSIPPSPAWDEDQLARSRALNSEGLDGLVPRATELIKLGFTFFLPMWPLILLIAGSVVVLYLTAPTFIHGAENVKPPPYVDPYKLLEENALSSPSYSPLDL